MVHNRNWRLALSEGKVHLHERALLFQGRISKRMRNQN